MLKWVVFTAGMVSIVAVLACAGRSAANEVREWASPRKFTLVYNVNNAGYIDVCGCKHKEVQQGSLTRRASYLRQLRFTGRDILLLDGGSSLFPVKGRVKEEHLEDELGKAALIVEAYNRMGYDSMAVGAFDIAAGIDALKDLEKKAKFTFLSANLVNGATGELYFTPYKIVEVGGVRIGIFGLTLETLTRPYLEKVAPDAVLRDPTEAAREVVAKLEGETDLIIALSHLREETNFELVKEVPAPQILIDPYVQYGNHHTWIKDHEWATMREDTLFLRSDGQGARLGVVDIEMKAPRRLLADAFEILDLEDRVALNEASAEERARLEVLVPRNRFEFARVSLEPHHLSDPEIDLLVDQWKKDIDPSRVARLDETLPGKDEFLTVEKCSSCHQAQYEFWKGTRHSNALASLTATGDQHRYDCIGCHSLGYGRAFLDTTKVDRYGDVQCESCHGTNPAHADAPAEHPFARIVKEDCLVCHNKEQTLKDFHFFQARRQVACPKG